MDFGDMLKEMKAHPEKKFARKGWNGKGIYIQLQIPDEHSKMTLPYIYMVTNHLVSNNLDAPRGLVPWLASQSDMLTDDDWVEIRTTPLGLIKIDSNACSITTGECKEEPKFDNQPNPKKDDSVHNPAHYCGDRKYQPWDVITDWDLDFLLGNAVKYIARAGRKQQAGMTMKQSEEQDIMKAIEYLQKRLDIMRTIRDFDDN